MQAVESLVSMTHATGVGKEGTGVHNVQHTSVNWVGVHQQDSIQSSQYMKPDLRMQPATEANPMVNEEDITQDGLHNGILEVYYNDTCEMEEHQWIRESPTVKGRLKCHISFWREIGAPEFIIDTIRHGYKIPFYTTPSSFKIFS